MKDISNPFIISEKIIPKYFCDRKEESAKLISLLENGNNVVLISPRRVGKTALIQYCYEQKKIKGNYYVFYIDILSSTNLREFIYLLVREIVSVLQSFGKKAIDGFLSAVKSLSAKLGYDTLNGVPTLNFQLGDITQPEYTLKEIFNYLNSASRPCIVAIDEFQQIAKYPEKGVEALMCSHILQINNCRFIFSGSERHLLEQMFVNPSRPFYSSSTLMELKVIPRDIYVDFIVEMFRHKKKKISGEIAKSVYDTFDGITFYIQRICNGIFDLTPPGGEASEGMMKEAIGTAIYGYDTLFRERLFRLTTRQKELLFAIAAEGVAEKVNSVEFIRKYSLNSASAVQTALKALLKMDIVAKELTGVRIPERFFAIWLKKNYV